MNNSEENENANDSQEMHPNCENQDQCTHICKRWKTGLRAFQNNVNKPSLVLSSSSDGNNDLSTPERNAVVMNISEEQYPLCADNNSKIIEGNFKRNLRPLTSKTTQILISSPVPRQSPISISQNPNLIQTPKQRPKTQFSKTLGVPPSTNNFTPKAYHSKLRQTQPIFRQNNQIYANQFNNLHKSFNAHYNRQKQAIDRFTAHDWEISQRLYERKANIARERIKLKEFDPNAKVRFFTDNFETEKVVENARRERNMNDGNCHTSYLEGRGKLPRSHGLLGTQQEHVFFWG